MTTDNRANDPTEAQVEAALAAHAAHKGAWVDEFREMVCPECGWCYMTAHERRTDSEVSNEVVYARVDAHRIRAALVAAQGAAPQAESVSRSAYISPSLPARIRGLYRADLRERSVQAMLDLAGDLIQELIDLRTAPVLSCGVDEDKLAEVIARVSHRAIDQGTNPRVECVDSAEVARAVAGWLKGQER